MDVIMNLTDRVESDPTKDRRQYREWTIKKYVVAGQKCDSQCPPRQHRSMSGSLKPKKRMYIELSEGRSCDQNREPDSYSPLL